MNTVNFSPCLAVSAPSHTAIPQVASNITFTSLSLLLALVTPFPVFAGVSEPESVIEESSADDDDLPPQEAAQAAAQPLPAWRPFDGLFRLFGTTPPEDLKITRSLADIHYPGPDFTNFPNGAFTLPKGGIYLEANPGAFTGGSTLSGAQWAMPYMLRYGLTNEIEVRVLSSGLSVESDTGTVGFSPIGFDTKIHLGVIEHDWFNATIGVEATAQTGKWLASPAFESDDQYTLNLLVDHFLPKDLSFEWNIGVTRHVSGGNDLYLPTVQWAFQRDVLDDIAVYIHGYHGHVSNADITAAGYNTARWPQQQLIGFGAQWIATERLAFYTGYSWGITRFSPDYTTNLGFAISL